MPRLRESHARPYGITSDSDDSSFFRTGSNFDNLAELILGDRSQPINAAIDQKPLDPSRINIVHMNGRLSSASDIQEEHFIRLSESSYLTQKFTQSQYHMRFRNDAHRERAIFVIGYSIPDLDIGMVLRGLNDNSSRIHFICANNEPNTTFERLKRFGTPHKIGVEGFAERVKTIKKTFAPSSLPPRRYCLRQFRPSDTSRQAGDRDRWSLYIEGKFRPDCYRAQLDPVNNRLYSIERSRASEPVRKKLESSESLVIP